MPYISPRQRMGIDPFLEGLIDCLDTPGEANYAISRLVRESPAFKEKCYLSICLVAGTLICVLLEYYRRWAAPYEDAKCTENGDLPVPEPHRTACSAKTSEDIGC